MSKTPQWLTEEGLGHINALGREMAQFLQDRRNLKSVDPQSPVEPHPQLLQLIADFEAKPGFGSRPDDPGEDG